MSYYYYYKNCTQGTYNNSAISKCMEQQFKQLLQWCKFNSS